ncbi:MAG TPA: hypothetical protein DD437_11610 [Rhodobiaceae bacterium]|nr:hypothetical protein [Rhodobiaceae bacterium]|tara:strand:+ start:223 stop:702 length:480 start_codon:yes stop_codon:yes gene_type:complete
MFFIGLMVLLALVTRIVQQMLPTINPDIQTAMRWGAAGAFLFAAMDHLTTPERYLPMMPDYLPAHSEFILFTGLCEIAGAIGLTIPRVMKLAGLMLAIYAVAILPANINNALNGLSVEGLPQARTYYWIRLGFQPLIIAWLLFAADWIKPSSIIPPQTR